MTQILKIGWREIVRLPEFNNLKLRAKIDTGARTSALHARNLRTKIVDGKQWAVFELKTGRGLKHAEFTVEVAEIRHVRSSNGKIEERPTIRTDIEMGGEIWPIYVTLTNRKRMKFPMLVGREALEGRTLIDPMASYLLGKS